LIGLLSHGCSHTPAGHYDGCRADAAKRRHRPMRCVSVCQEHVAATRLSTTCSTAARCHFYLRQTVVCTNSNKKMVDVAYDRWRQEDRVARYGGCRMTSLVRPRAEQSVMLHA